MRRVNWAILAGFLLSLGAMFSYPFLFVRWPITRDVPWVNYLLFGLAGFLLYKGVRRSWQPGRWRMARILTSLVMASLSLLVAGTFLYNVLILSRRLPPSTGAPQAGQTAPAFTLPDIHGTPVALSTLLSEPIASRPPRGVLLIFYRGYW